MKKEEKSNLSERTKASALKLRQEMRKAVVTAITAAFGFLIALAWRDVITEYVNKITALSPVQGKLISAATITLVAVIGIVIVSRFAEKKARIFKHS